MTGVDSVNKQGPESTLSNYRAELDLVAAKEKTYALFSNSQKERVVLSMLRIDWYD